MYQIRKILVILFIVSASVTVNSVMFAVQDSPSIQLNSTDLERYDDFDAMADDMVDMGVVQDEPKQLSTVERWMQAVCSPIIMKYVLLKGYMRQWCYWMVGVKKS